MDPSRTPRNTPHHHGTSPTTTPQRTFPVVLPSGLPGPKRDGDRLRIADLGPVGCATPLVGVKFLKCHRVSWVEFPRAQVRIPLARSQGESRGVPGPQQHPHTPHGPRTGPHGLLTHRSRTPHTHGNRDSPRAHGSGAQQTPPPVGFAGSPAPDTTCTPPHGPRMDPHGPRTHPSRTPHTPRNTPPHHHHPGKSTFADPVRTCGWSARGLPFSSKAPGFSWLGGAPRAARGGLRGVENLPGSAFFMAAPRSNP